MVGMTAVFTIDEMPGIGTTFDHVTACVDRVDCDRASRASDERIRETCEQVSSRPQDPVTRSSR